MKDLPTWIANVKTLIERLRSIDLGYPLGSNSVVTPQASSVVEHELRAAQVSDPELAAFYASCDGVVLSDIHVGYFIKPVAKLCIADLSSEPLAITGEFAGQVLPFGSTGGGGLFVQRRLVNDVLHLAPGPLDFGIYDGRRGRVRRVAGSFFAFLDCLEADVRGFVESKIDHRFIC